MKFNYQARDKEGTIQSGVVEASSREAALQILDRYGLYVTILEEAGEQPIFAKRISLFDRVSRKDVMLFSRQLSIMFKSEVPLVEALRAIAEQTGKDAFQERILKISEAVEGGTALSDAMAAHPDAFSSFYVSMVQSGEASGTLSDVLEYLADHEEREYELVSRIRGALIYPSFVVFIAFAVLFMMMFFVIPNISTVIQQTGQELPLVTRIIIVLSDILRGWWWLILLFLIALVIGIFRYFKTPQGHRLFSTYSLRVPLLGSFLRTIFLTRFAENLATLVAGGIPIVQALEITGRIVGNEVYQDIIQDAKEGVQKGERISGILGLHPKEFPPIFTRMVFIGEKSGSLDSTLNNVVRFYRSEVERTIEGFLGILEPALIVLLGIAVGGLMAAILLPLYQSISF